MYKIFLVLVLCFELVGCATTLVHPTYEGCYRALSKKEGKVRIFEYPYPKVFKATIETLRNLGLSIYKRDFNQNMIYSRHSHKDVFGYAYLFLFRPIDDNHTEVILKASGGIVSISDEDMLEKYLRKELESMKISQDE